MNREKVKDIPHLPFPTKRIKEEITMAKPSINSYILWILASIVFFALALIIDDIFTAFSFLFLGWFCLIVPSILNILSNSPRMVWNIGDDEEKPGTKDEEFTWLGDEYLAKLDEGDGHE